MYVFAACLKQQVKTLCCVALPLPDTHPFRCLPGQVNGVALSNR